MATVLEIVQGVAPRMGIPSPTSLLANASATERELLSVVNEVAKRIARAHDWRVLKTEATNTGDGTTTNYALPSDYWRFPKDAQVWSTRWQHPLRHIDPEEDLRFDVRNFDVVIGTWTLLGGDIKFRPALAAGEDARWLYISKNIVRPNMGDDKEGFTADDDTFLLDDRLLGLSLIAEWRQMKGFDYAEDLAAAQEALSQLISEDKGPRVITQSSRKTPLGKIAYPLSIIP